MAGIVFVLCIQQHAGKISRGICQQNVSICSSSVFWDFSLAKALGDISSYFPVSVQSVLKYFHIICSWGNTEDVREGKETEIPDLL